MAEDLQNDDIGKLEELKPFEGGMKSQRDHLNKLVAAVNTIIRAYKKGKNGAKGASKGLLDGMERRLFYVTENGAGGLGEKVAYQIPAQKIIDPQV
jgi:hypothetical protein